MAEKPRCAIWGKPGVGKSVFTLTHLEIAYRVMGDTRPTLVLAPLRVARDGWAKEASKWDHLAGFDVVPITGDADQRKAALRKDAPVYTTNYDNLLWLIDHLEETRKPWPFRRVVADEAVRLKGFRLRQGTARSQALGRHAHTSIEEFIELTGTPSPNGLKDLWGQAWFLDEGRRLGRTYSAFQSRWFRPKPRAGSQQFTQWEPTETAADEIHERLADLCLSLDPRDWFDMKEPIVNVIEVEIPPSARAKYREMERELFTMIGDQEIEAFSAAALSNKCLQIANGAAYLDPERYGAGAWVEVHREKLDALGELVEETGDDPLLVVYEFKSDRERLLREWPDALDLAVERDLALAKAGKGKVWIGHPASIGEGIDGLQEWCNTVVFFGQTWRLDLHDQVLERVGPMRQMQAGKDRAVFVHYIVASGTVDQVVVARRDGKRSVQEALMSYMKERK